MKSAGWAASSITPLSIFNHCFYWKSLKPKGGGQPDGKLGDAIKKAFGGFEHFRKKFSETAVTHFGSGWA